MADEWSKDEKSIPAPPAGGAVPNASRADQNGKRVKWTSIPLLSSLIYGFATIVGYFYAKSYYGSFGIDILNYVAPIDLLLISIEQIEDIAPFIFLVVPALLVWIIFGLPTLLLLTYVALVVLSLAPFSIVLAIEAVLDIVIAAVRTLAIWLYWRWKALWATLAERVKRIGKWIKQIVRQHTKPQGSARDEGENPIHAGDDAEVGEKPVVFAAAYQEAMAQSHASKSFREDRYFTAAKNIWEIFEQAWKEAWEWHRERLDKLFGKRKDGALNAERGSDGAVRALVRFWQYCKQLRKKLVWPWVVFVFWLIFLIYVVGFASLNGRADAEKILKLAERYEQQTPNASGDTASGDTSQPYGIGAVADTQTKDKDAKNTNGDTKEQSDDQGLFKFWTAFIDPSKYQEAFCLIVQQDSCRTESIPILSETVYAIPTGNLASLEFTDCTDEKRSKNKAQANGIGKYVRANFRHDAGSDARPTTPDCLVYLGATGSMHFFADFSGNSASEEPNDQADIQSAPSVVVILNSGDRSAPIPEPPPPKYPPTGEEEVGQPADDSPVGPNDDGENGTVSADSCHLIALVGPFETGKSDKFDKAARVEECPVFNQCQSVTCLKHSNISTEIEKVRDGAGPLVLVGRADIRPIKNRKYKSNMELTRARVEWVKKLLDEKQPPLSVSVLSIPGGPSDLKPEDNPCARIVEIYQCPLREPGPVADTEDATK